GVHPGGLGAEQQLVADGAGGELVLRALEDVSDAADQVLRAPAAGTRGVPTPGLGGLEPAGVQLPACRGHEASEGESQGGFSGAVPAGQAARSRLQGSSDAGADGVVAPADG